MSSLSFATLLWLLASLLAVTAAWPAHAADPPAASPATASQTAVEAVRRGDFAEAYCLWRPLAEQGDAEAQFQIGWLYANGQGLRQNPTTAADWWERAAHAGHPDADLAIAQAYQNGRGRNQDFKQAVYWMLVAARNGNDEAQAIIRGMAGKGVEPAVAEVARLLHDGGWPVLGGALRISADSANLREKPNTSAKIVGKMKNGAQLILLLRRDKWLRIGVVGTGQIAWVYARLVGKEKS